MLGTAALFHRKKQGHQGLCNFVIDAVDRAVRVAHAGLGHFGLGLLKLSLLFKDESTSLCF